eukprot:9788543-Lingulodinium_polyedra.AAC.1
MSDGTWRIRWCLSGDHKAAPVMGAKHGVITLLSPFDKRHSIVVHQHGHRRGETSSAKQAPAIVLQFRGAARDMAQDIDIENLTR